MPCGPSKESCNKDENGHCAFEDLDHSVLQQPLNLGITNVKQILKCIQSGSKEVKDIILNECNIIYECKACNGLFRSLANFLYHKRCYCKKHLCESMVLFENFEEEEIITVQPEAPSKSPGKSFNSSTSKLVDCTVNLVKTDLAQEMDLKNRTLDGASSSSKEKNADKSKAKIVLEKTESSMISRRTRDKNAQNPSSSKMGLKPISPEEPPIKCAKVLSTKVVQKDSSEKSTPVSTKKDNQSINSKIEVKTKKIEISKFPVIPEKKVSPFPKIIFKAIDSNPHAVFQSSDKKKIESFGINSKYDNSTVQTKVDNDKLIIVLKKDVKSDNPLPAKSRESSKQSEMDKLSDFHLTRRKRLMSRNDCNVYELRCLTCKTQFMSLKTLYFHMLSLHSKKRLYYPCPFCKTLFVQMYGVTRHLISIHNKTKEQINKLREIIKKKSVWKRIDDVNPAIDLNVSPVNYQIKTDLQPEVKIEIPKPVEPVKSEPETPQSVIKLGKNVTLHKCEKCNRVFGRKSSQVSHQKFCIMNPSVKIETADTSSTEVSTTPSVVSLSPSLSPLKPAPSRPTNVILVNKSENIQSTPPSFERRNLSDIKISIRPKRGAEKQMHKDFVNSQTLKWRSANRIDTNTNNKPPLPVKKATGKNLEKKVLSIMNAETLMCVKCDKKFSSYSNLRRHVAIHVGWTRFKCKYCDYQAYNKSQCWTHIQKAHGVDDDDIGKCIVNLVNTCPTTTTSKKLPLSNTHSTSRRKTGIPTKSPSSKSTSPTKAKYSKKKSLHSKNTGSEKKQVQLLKKEQLQVKKEVAQTEPEKEFVESKKEKTHSVMPIVKLPKKDITEMKKDKPQNTITVQKVSKKEEVESKTIQKFPKKEEVESKTIQKFPKKEEVENKTIQKFPKKEEVESKKERPQATITIQKFPRKEIIESKKEKPQHIIPLQKLTIPSDYKRDANYKSVTTSNPTTIILSKKISSSTTQSIMTISPESMSSTSKISPIRTSPRKPEIKGSEDKLITTLVTRSTVNTKMTPIQIKLPERSNSVEEIPLNSEDKNCTKKERLISEWFPKKDLSSTNVRRDSAPLIIGLVPAGATNAGQNARAKSSTITFERNSP